MNSTMRKAAMWAGAVLAVVLIALAAWIAVHGRIDFDLPSGHRAIRRVTPVSLAAWLVLVGIGAAIGRGRREQALERAALFLSRHASRIAAALSLSVVLIASADGAFTAAGADPYGYVSQSILWAHGNPVQVLPDIARTAPVDPFAFCPLGYRPGLAPGTMVPTYAPGLPLQMAILEKIAGAAAGFYVLPILGGLVAWFSYALARRIMPAGAALIAMTCAVTSPILLFELFQPMSDVPVTAWWLMAIEFALSSTSAAALASGFAASVAILTRPNTAPLLLPLILFVTCSRRHTGSRDTRATLCVGAAIPGILIVAATNTILYGSPTMSGYGALNSIFSVQSAAGTAWQYFVWLWELHSLYVFVPLFLPLLLLTRLERAVRPVAPLVLRFMAFFIVNLSCYVLYLRFDHWSFLRFLLPSIPLLLLGATAVITAAIAGTGRTARAAALAFIVLMFPFAYVHTAAKGAAFVLKRGFQVAFEDPAAFARDKLPANAAFICLTQSGSLRFYGERLTIRYDYVNPDQLDSLIEFLHRRGITTFAALSRGEIEDFRSKFASTAAIRRAVDVPTSAPDGEVIFLALNGAR